MLLNLLFIVISLVLIVAGANYLTEGASSVATRFKIPQMVIGLTIVAFGTSAPELTVSVIAGLEGNGGIAVGNVIGSNIFNALAILGVTALIMPLPVGPSSRNFDIPLSILCAVILMFVLGDPQLDGKSVSELSRSEGLLLLCFGLLFLSYTIYMGKKGSQRMDEVPAAETKQIKPWLAVVYIIGGLAALVGGGRLFVDSASEVARFFGLSETLIGLTLVSWGTSMPELATSVVAALKKNTEIAIGNVVGSNIFNILFVLGFTGAVGTQSNLQFSMLDVFMQLAAPLLLFIFSRFVSVGRIQRWEGALFLGVFALYTYYLISVAL